MLKPEWKQRPVLTESAELTIVDSLFQGPDRQIEDKKKASNNDALSISLRKREENLSYFKYEKNLIRKSYDFRGTMKNS